MQPKLLALFFAGLFFLNYPVLSLFGPDPGVFPVPPLYIYLFCCWMAIIFLSIWIIESGRKSGPGKQETPFKSSKPPDTRNGS